MLALLTQHEAAELLRVTERTLERLRIAAQPDSEQRSRSDSPISAGCQ